MEGTSTANGHSEEVVPGIWRRLLTTPHRILEYRLEDISAVSLKHWGAVALQTLQSWPKDQPYLALHDVSATRVGLKYIVMVKYEANNIVITQDAWQHAKPMLMQWAGFKGRVALLFNTSQSGNLAALTTMRRAGVSDGLNIQYRNFFNREKALAWLSTPDNQQG